MYFFLEYNFNVISSWWIITEFLKRCTIKIMWTSQVALVVKYPPANAGDPGDTVFIHGSGRSPGGGHGSPLQYSCLENFMNKGAWQTRVHRVTQSQTRLKWLSTHAWSLSHAEIVKWMILWTSVFILLMSQFLPFKKSG